MKKHKIMLRIFAVSLLFLLNSCVAAKWEAKIDSLGEFSWPPPPNPLRVKYVGELASFSQTGKSLKSIIFGKSDSGKLHKPVAISLGQDGRIAIADLKRKGVHLFIPSSEKYKFLSSFNKIDLTAPVSVVFDNDLRLYISDSGLAKVLIFDSDGKFLSEITHAGSERLKRPTGIAFHSQLDIIYLVDTLAHKVHIYDSDGNYKKSFGKRGTGDGEFNLPTHIAVGRNGKVYVNDAMNFRAQVFSPPSIFLAKFGVHGNGSGDFAMPKGIAVDRDENIYVAETLFDLVQVFNLGGDFLLSIGAKGEKPGEFWMPSGLFIDRYEKLYICDTYNSRVQIFQLVDRALGGVE